MTNKRVCGKCGAELTGVGAERLCPGCLLEGGLEAASASLPADSRNGKTAASDAGRGHPEKSQTEVAALRNFGDYELLEEIARGGMGIVYKARQASLDRFVAVKMLLFGPLAQPEFVQRFRAEAAAAASLQHPNIVAIHEVGFREGQHFFVMDYVAGRSLADMVRDGPLPAKRAAAYVKTIAEAIQYAHERGILHRDLKPSNVLVDEHDQPKVTDFGLAKRLEKQTELTLSGQVLGSPSYMSPEQAAAHRGLVGKRSDVYSLGAILYHLLAGRAPFVASTVMETLAQVQNAEPVSLRILNPHLPRDLDTICLKCLEKEPDKRYATAQAMADELGRFLNNQPILARPVSRPEKVWRWCRRKPLVASLAGAVMLAVLVGFAGVAWEGQQARKARDLAQGRLYAAQMKLAHAAYKAGKTGGALELLKAQKPLAGQPDFRGFDWRFLYRLCSSSHGDIIATNASGFQSVGFAPDHRTVALGTGNGRVEIVDLGIRQRVKGWQAHRGVIDGLAFCPSNGNWLATTSGDDGLLKLWNVADQRAFLATNAAKGMFVNVAFSPNGRFLATGNPDANSMNLWEIQFLPSDRMPVLVLKTNLTFRGPAAFSPDGRIVAVCRPFVAGLYNLTSEKLTYLPREHTDILQCATFSPSGNMLATGGADERIVVWDVRNPEKPLPFLRFETNFGLVTSIAFSPGSQTLFAACWDQNIRFWHLKTPGQMFTLPGHSAGVNSVALSSDGDSLASASSDGTARLWSLRIDDAGLGEQPQAEFSTLLGSDNASPPATGIGSVYGAAVASKPRRVAAAAHEKLALCDLATGAELGTVFATNVFTHSGGKIRSVAFSPDGRILAVGGDFGELAFLDGVTLQPLKKFDGVHRSQITDIAFGLNGAILVTGGGFGSGITLTDVTSGQTITNFSAIEGSFPVQPLAVSRDGKRLATGSPEGHVRVWDIASRQLVARSPQPVRFLQCTAFSPDGSTLAFADESGTIFLWDYSRKKLVRKLAAHSGSPIALAFSPDGTLAVASMDHTIKLWNPAIDQEVATLEGHNGWVWCVAFSQEGDILVSGSRDGTLKVWRALSFEQIEAQGTIQARSQ